MNLIYIIPYVYNSKLFLKANTIWAVSFDSVVDFSMLFFPSYFKFSLVSIDSFPSYMLMNQTHKINLRVLIGLNLMFF